MVAQHGGPGDQTAQRMTHQVDRAPVVAGHGRRLGEHVPGQFLQRVRGLLARAGALVLTAPVDRDHPEAGAASGSSSPMKSSLLPVYPGTSRAVPRSGSPASCTANAPRAVVRRYARARAAG